MRTLRRHNKTLTWMLSPVVAFGSIWLLQALVYIALPIKFVPLDAETWVIVLIGYISLVLGAVAFILINQNKTQGRFIDNNTITESIKVDLRLLYASITISAISALFLMGIVEKNEVGFLHSLKESILAESTAGNKAIIYMIYIFIYQILLTIFYFNTIGFKKDIKSGLFFFAAIFSSLMSGSRGLLIFFLIALIPCIISKRHEINFNGKIFGVILLFIIAFFFSYPFLFQGMSVEEEGGWVKLYDYISVYLFSGISAFNDVLKTNTPHYDCFLTIPRPLLSALDAMLQTNMLATCPAIFDVKHLPLPTNVYTIFFAPYHDIGLMGIVLYLFIIGFVSQIFFTKGCIQNDDIWRFFYGIFFYTIILSFFEDQFSRGVIYYVFGLAVFLSNKLIKRW